MLAQWFQVTFQTTVTQNLEILTLLKGVKSKKSCLHIVENASALRVQICENVAGGIVTNQNPNGINRKSFQTLTRGV